MDAFVKRCEHCNEPLPKRSVVDHKNTARIDAAKRTGKSALRTGNDLRYRTGRVKPKAAPQER